MYHDDFLQTKQQRFIIFRPSSDEQDLPEETDWPRQKMNLGP